MADKPKMSEAARKARADYIREWRKKNPEKRAQYEANHWERVAKREAEKVAETADQEHDDTSTND